MKNMLRRGVTWRVAVCLLVIVGALSVNAQEVISTRVSASASHKEKVKKTRDSGFTWIDVEGKDTYRVSATFILNQAPADWSYFANDIDVSVGDISCSPDIKKSKAKKGSATFKEKDKEFKSSINCTVKWSKNTITLTLAGSNFEEDSLISFVDEDEPKFEEEIDISVDLGGISCEATIVMRGTLSVQQKTVKSGKGEDAEIDDFELINWRASGSAKQAGGGGGGIRMVLGRK